MSDEALEPSLEEKGNKSNVTNFGKKNKKGQHKIDLWADDQAYNAEVFEDETDIVEFRTSAGGVIKAEIRLNALSPQNLEDYDEAVRLSSFFGNRVNALFNQLAKIEDIGDFDAILAGGEEPDMGSDESEELWNRIKELKPRTSSMKVSIESVLIPTVVKWNYRRNGEILPIDIDSIKTGMAIGDVTGLAQAITKRLTSGKVKGKK